MLDTRRIESRIKELRRRAFELKTKFKNLPEHRLITDETLYSAAEHHLQIAIQCCLDISAYIVSALAFPIAKEEAGEVFLSLAKERNEFSFSLIYSISSFSIPVLAEIFNT